MIKDLVTNKDIKAINEKFNKEGAISPNETTLLREHQLSESQIQTACHNIIKNKYGYLKNCDIDFIQIDNGGKSGINQKKIKKAEGTRKGFFDVVIILHRKLTSSEYMYSPRYANYAYQVTSGKIYIEFKKIGIYKISNEQQYWHDKYMNWCESTHFCNNTPYFQQIICKEIDSFLREYLIDEKLDNDK